MVKEIVWTRASVQDRYKIYQFWLANNGTDTYSEKLEILFDGSARLISLFPEVGTKTDFPEIRVKVIRNYKLFYRSKPGLIEIIRVWDTRQDPTDLKLG